MIGELVDEAALDRDAVLDMTIVGESDHAPRAARHRPDTARPGTVPPRHRRCRHARATDLDLDARFSSRRTSSRASPDMSAPTPPERCSPRARIAATNCSCSSTSGTNAEIVFGNANHVLAASRPTGPGIRGRADLRRDASDRRRDRTGPDRPRHTRTAGEGDRCRRVVGRRAVRRCRRSRLDISGICGSGIIEVMGELYLAGLIDVDGTIRSDGPSKTRPRLRRRAHVLVPTVRRLATILAENINVTQDDVRAIQLAKAALRAGIDLLCEHAGHDRSEHDRFGPTRRRVRRTHRSALREGARPRPRCAGRPGRIGRQRRRCRAPCGRSLSRAQRDEIEATVRRVEKIETATEPRFQELFVNAMGFPHTSDPTPNLATETELPAAQRARRVGRSSPAHRSPPPPDAEPRSRRAARLLPVDDEPFCNMEQFRMAERVTGGRDA